MSTRNKLTRRGLITGAAALASYRALAEGIGGPVGGISDSTFGGLSAGGGGGAALPLRQVATRGRISDNITTVTAQAMSKSFHFNRSGAPVTALGVRLPNWYANSASASNEIGQGGPCTFEVSVEYPLGVATRQHLTFGGATTFTAADNTDTDTDIVTLTTPIPNNAQFNIWIFRSGMTNMVWWAQRSTGATQDQCNFGSSVTNVVATGTLTSSTGSQGYGPSAIFARSNCKAIYLGGDSRVAGTGDTSDATGDLGELARSIGPSLPYINAGSPSTKVQSFITAGNYTKRVKLANDFCTGEVSNYAINDLNGSRVATLIAPDLVTYHALFPSLKKFQTTIYCYSTGAWTLVDGSDQTTGASNAQRVALNTLIRAGLSGVDGFFDSVLAVSLSPTDDTIGKFNATGSAGSTVAYTVDGLHATILGTQAIQTLGAINPALF
jgi:hypothetical protein